MKNLVVILVIFIFNCTYSQIIENYGFKIGVSYSKIDRDYKKLEFDYETKHKFGVSFSAFAISHISSNIKLFTEFGFAQKGFSEEYIKTNVNGEQIGTFLYKESINYLTLKLLPHYEIGINSVTPFIFLGPKIDIKLGNNSNDEEFSFGKISKDIQLGVCYGVGVEVTELIKYPFIIELSSSYDFSDSFENDFLRLKNISYELTIGFKF